MGNFPFYSACDLISKENSGHQVVVHELKDLLTEEDSYPASEIFAKGKTLGISKRTLENSKQELGIKSIRVGTGWHWKLP